MEKNNIIYKNGALQIERTFSLKQSVGHFLCADYVQNSKQLKILFLLNYYMKDFKQLTLMLFFDKKEN